MPRVHAEYVKLTGMNNSKSQFSLRATVVLTAAVAFWLWFLRQTSPLGGQPGEITVYTGLALTAGIVGHVVYTFWLPWRVTVIVTSFLLYAVALVLFVAWDQHLDVTDSLWFLFITLVPPRVLIDFHSWNWISMLICLLTTLILAPAHSIRPSLPSAIITALGIAAWYVTGLSMSVAVFGG